MSEKEMFDMLNRVLYELEDEHERRAITCDNCAMFGDRDDEYAKADFYRSLRYKAVKEERRRKRQRKS